MKEKFNEAINSVILSSVLTLILGLIIVIFPKISIDTLGIIVAIFMIMYGVAFVYLDIKAAQYYIPFDGFISGIVSVLIGILLLCKPAIVSVILTIVIGIWMIVSSINCIKIALKLTKTNLPWVLILILGIIDLLAGIIVLVNPFEATVSLTLFAGIMLMVHSVINIIDMFIIKKDVKEISQAITNKLKELSKLEKSTN